MNSAVIAHVSGLPIEELAPLASGAGTVFFLRAWLRLRVGRAAERMRG